MYSTPQPQLAGGAYYYGPPIPPQPHTIPRRRLCCCLLSTLTKLIVTFLFSLALLVLILYLVYRPHKLQVDVQNASLTQFKLTNNTNLYYNLSTNITLRNPNKKIGIYYDWLEADAFYRGVRFSWVPLPTFYQGHKNTSVVEPMFQGSALFVNGDLEGFKGDNGSGYFRVDVWMYARVRYKFGTLITRRYVARVKCELGLKLVSSNRSENSGFVTTECDVVDF